jgi:C-1 hydroxylase
MSLTAKKSLVKAFVEDVFNKHNVSAVEKYLAEGQQFKEFLKKFFKAFPDWHARIEQIIAEDDCVMVFLNGSGTQRGEFQGQPPTNKQVNIRSADLYRIGNNKIIGHWDVVDQLNLLRQTGTTM